jgi:hypothetical protein
LDLLKLEVTHNHQDHQSHQNQHMSSDIQLEEETLEAQIHNPVLGVKPTLALEKVDHQPQPVLEAQVLAQVKVMEEKLVLILNLDQMLLPILVMEKEDHQALPALLLALPVLLLLEEMGDGNKDAMSAIDLHKSIIICLKIDFFVMIFCLFC